MSEEWNIEVAARLRRLPPYLFGQINALKHAKRVAGIDVIDLGMGNPTDPPPQEVVEKLCQAAHDRRNHRYSASNGLLNLRREAPCFPVHVYAVALAGANVIRVRLGNDEEFLRRVADVAEHLYPRPKCLILNYPHNPTAATVDGVEFFEAVADLARRTGVLVIHDFAYGRTCFDGYVAPSFLQARGARQVGVEFVTLSKPYNLAGWRIGFCAGNAEMIRALATIKGYYDYGIFSAIQIAGIIAMRHCEQAVTRQAQRYQRRRDVVVEGLRRLGWDVQRPRGGMFVWGRVPHRHLDGQGSIDFALRLIEQAEVAVAPGRAFGEHGEGFVRIALVENVLRLKQAIRQIDRALNKGVKAPSARRLARRGRRHAG
jgi:alanine-synthesizing transaminase